MPLTVVVLPGNGCSPIRQCNWYHWAECELKKRGFDVRMQDIPDPLYCREHIWTPFILNTLLKGFEDYSNVVLVGHSTGAVTALRLAEAHRFRALILVAAYRDPLGCPLQVGTGLFDRPFDWRAVAGNVDTIVQMASTDDCFLPLKEQLLVKTALELGEEDPQRMYLQFDHRDHFFESPFPELIERVQLIEELSDQR
jgi:pimeloyl-ACP methyl ester carboxylesterase